MTIDQNRFLDEYNQLPSNNIKRNSQVNQSNGSRVHSIQEQEKLIKEQLRQLEELKQSRNFSSQREGKLLSGNSLRDSIVQDQKQNQKAGDNGTGVNDFITQPRQFFNTGNQMLNSSTFDYTSSTIQHKNISPLNRTFFSGNTYKSGATSNNQNSLFNKTYFYEDCSIGSEDKRRERKMRSLVRMKQMEEQKLLQIQAFQRKAQIARVYFENYGIQTKEKELLYVSEIELEMNLKRRVLRQKIYRCARKIQAYFKMKRCRRLFEKYMEYRHLAARKLQSFWKRYHRWQLIPQTLFLRKNQASVRVQKYLKSYLAYKQTTVRLQDQKLQSCFSYFNAMKLKMLINTQIIVAYHWRKYHKAKLIKLQLEELKIKPQKINRQNTRKKSGNKSSSKVTTSMKESQSKGQLISQFNKSFENSQHQMKGVPNHHGSHANNGVGHGHHQFNINNLVGGVNKDRRQVVSLNTTSNLKKQQDFKRGAQGKASMLIAINQNQIGAFQHSLAKVINVNRVINKQGSNNIQTTHRRDNSINSIKNQTATSHSKQQLQDEKLEIIRQDSVTFAELDTQIMDVLQKSVIEEEQQSIGQKPGSRRQFRQ
eukprot:403361715